MAAAPRRRPQLRRSVRDVVQRLRPAGGDDMAGERLDRLSCPRRRGPILTYRLARSAGASHTPARARENVSTISTLCGVDRDVHGYAALAAGPTRAAREAGLCSVAPIAHPPETARARPIMAAAIKMRVGGHADRDRRRAAPESEISLPPVPLFFEPRTLKDARRRARTRADRIGADRQGTTSPP